VFAAYLSWWYLFIGFQTWTSREGLSWLARENVSCIYSFSDITFSAGSNNVFELQTFQLVRDFGWDSHAQLYADYFSLHSISASNNWQDTLKVVM
jgi:hypothetical protein